MLNVNEIEENYDEMEKVVERYSFEELYERYNGYNLFDDIFDIKYDDYIFTIKKRQGYDDSCILTNDFLIFYNNKWLEFERW